MKHIAFDVETYEKTSNGLEPVLNSQEFILGGYLKESGVYKTFENPNSMAEALIEEIENTNKHNGEKTYIWGFNTQYDFTAVFRDYLKENLSLIFPNGRMIKILTYYPFMAMYGNQEENGFFKPIGFFVDLMSYYRMSLKEVGEMINFPKLEMPEKISDVSELETYLKRDCEITLKGIMLIKDMLKELDFKPKRYLTAGNTAITCFLTFTKKNNTHYVYSYAGRTFKGKNIDKFRAGFRGGRFECFKTGSWDNCTQIDCNAMYPYIMMNMDFPLLKKEYYTKDTVELQMAIERKIGVIKARVTAPNNLRYGYLPIRMGNLTYYPIGRQLEGMWTTIELKRAKELGYTIDTVYEGVYFDKSEINPFTDYLQHLWDLRRKSVGVKKHVLKLLMNNLYGKWSQYRSDDDIRIIKRKELPEMMKKGYKFLRCENTDFVIYKKGKLHTPRYANPIISMIVTAHARDYLYNVMSQIKPENLLYVATDGLIIKDTKLSDLDITIGDDIGEFKIEKEGFCKILGENRYRFNDTIKLAGIPKRDINLDVFEGNKKVTVKKMVGIKQALSNHYLRDKIGTFETEEIQITESMKNDTILPALIVEPDKFKTKLEEFMENDQNKKN